MYKCVGGSDCASFYDFALSRFWNDSDSLVFYENKKGQNTKKLIKKLQKIP
jgi:hypothetical protein